MGQRRSWRGGEGAPGGMKSGGIIVFRGAVVNANFVRVVSAHFAQFNDLVASFVLELLRRIACLSCGFHKDAIKL